MPRRTRPPRRATRVLSHSAPHDSDEHAFGAQSGGLIGPGLPQSRDAGAPPPSPAGTRAWPRALDRSPAPQAHSVARAALAPRKRAPRGVRSMHARNRHRRCCRRQGSRPPPPTPHLSHAAAAAQSASAERDTVARPLHVRYTSGGGSAPARAPAKGGSPLRGGPPGRAQAAAVPRDKRPRDLPVCVCVSVCLFICGSESVCVCVEVAGPGTHRWRHKRTRDLPVARAGWLGALCRRAAARRARARARGSGRRLAGPGPAGRTGGLRWMRPVRSSRGPGPGPEGPEAAYFSGGLGEGDSHRSPRPGTHTHTQSRFISLSFSLSFSLSSSRSLSFLFFFLSLFLSHARTSTHTPTHPHTQHVNPVYGGGA